jgi:hypothetical protein
MPTLPDHYQTISRRLIFRSYTIDHRPCLARNRPRSARPPPHEGCKAPPHHLRMSSFAAGLIGAMRMTIALSCRRVTHFGYDGPWEVDRVVSDGVVLASDMVSLQGLT